LYLTIFKEKRSPTVIVLYDSMELEGRGLTNALYHVHLVEEFAFLLFIIGTSAHLSKTKIKIRRRNLNPLYSFSFPFVFYFHLPDVV